jgi:hypothetical protein
MEETPCNLKAPGLRTDMRTVHTALNICLLSSSPVVGLKILRVPLKILKAVTETTMFLEQGNLENNID